MPSVMVCLGLGQPTRCSAAMRTPQIPNHDLVARRPVSWPPPRSAPSARRGELLRAVVVHDAGFPRSPGARRTATGKPPRRNHAHLAKTLAAEIIDSRDSPRAASESERRRGVGDAHEWASPRMRCVYRNLCLKPLTRDPHLSLKRRPASRYGVPDPLFSNVARKIERSRRVSAKTVLAHAPGRRRPLAPPAPVRPL